MYMIIRWTINKRHAFVIENDDESIMIFETEAGAREYLRNNLDPKRCQIVKVNKNQFAI